MNDLVITNKGQELIAKMIAGTSTATFTKVETSSHDYSGETLENLTSLVDVEQSSLVSKTTRTDTTLVEVLAAFDNKEVSTGYYVKAIGLYAKDSDENEILYAVATDDNPDYMPEYGGKTVSGISYRLNTKVDKSSQVTIEVNPAATPTIEQVDAIDVKVDTHTSVNVYGETGVHGFRYYNETLQVKNDEGEWVDIESGGGISPNNVSDFSIKVGNGKLTVFWSDPGDTVIEGQTICTWKGTKLIQKVGSYPTNVKDGTQLVDNQVLDNYKENGFEITGLTNGTTYYFQLFPYSDQNVYNNNTANQKSGTPQPYKKLTVKVDLSNSNPSSSVSIADDAIGMTQDEIKAWFGHYPCLFKDGVEVGKLNPEDFTKFEDGSSADITTVGNDVMIAFPRRGLNISTSGSIVTISFTDDPDNSDFEYNAHTRGTTAKDIFYIGAYKGYVSSSKLYSSSGKTPTASQTIGTFRTYAHNRGTGYEQSGFYQLIYRQAMYLMIHQNLNSQTTVGYGYVNSSHSACTSTGNTNAYGMDSEVIKASNPTYMTDQNHQVKCLGIEDFWGNIWEWIDGIVTNSTWNILTGNDNFNDSGSGYTDNGQGATANVSGYLTVPQGKTKTGFLAKTCGGSDSTYFCDSAHLYSSCVTDFGGGWLDASYAGAFLLNVDASASASIATLAARLMYL